MRTIVLNYNDTKLDPKIEAFALKTSFLLCDEVVSAGSTSFNLYADKHMANMPIKVELKLLEDRHKDNAEFLEAVQRIRETYKLASKVKYRTKEQIASQRRLEKTIHDLWMQTLQDFMSMYNSSGMSVVKELYEDNNDYMGFYIIDMEPETSTAMSVKASELLQGNTPDKDTVSEMFFLGAEFFLYDFEKTDLYKATDAEAENINHGYLHTCFTIPNINLLTATELKAVRRQLQEPGRAFRQKTEEWMQLCNSNADAYIRTSFFRECVLPAAATLQQSVEQNETLKHCNNLLNDSVQMEVLVGEIPVWQLWDYYKHVRVIKEETWNKLQQIKEAGNMHLQRWPVMVLYSPGDEHLDIDNINSDLAEIAGVKKSISID